MIKKLKRLTQSQEIKVLGHINSQLHLDTDEVDQVQEVDEGVDEEVLYYVNWQEGDSLMETGKKAIVGSENGFDVDEMNEFLDKADRDEEIDIENEENADKHDLVDRLEDDNNEYEVQVYKEDVTGFLILKI